MATLKLTGFIGEIPKLLPRLLPDMSSTQCFNTRLTDGGLEPIRRSRKILTLSPAPAGDDSTIYYHNNTWYSWPGLVHAAPGPVADDRLYVFGDGVPKMVVAGTTYNLAITEPSAALTAVVNGTGNGEPVTRLYAYTFVTSFGEETRPSPLTADVTWEPGQTVTLSGFEAGDAGRAVTTQRIYRSQTGQQGTELFLIAERAASVDDFVDDIPSDDFAEPIPSTLWSPPPDALEGLVSMPNGMMVAYKGRDVYFCEPYRPHAWPENYILTVDYPIMGLGAFGSSLVITTTGNPYIASGTSPDSMVMERLELKLPCINKRGVVDLGYAVAYPSHDGLVVASSGGARIATESLFSRDDWQQLDPASFTAGQYDGRYFAAYQFVNERNEIDNGTLIIDLSGEQPFIIRTDVYTKSFHYHLESGRLYYLVDDGILLWDAPGRPNALQAWRSKEFVMPRPTNFGAALVEVVDTLTPEEVDAIEEEIANAQAANVTAYDQDLQGDINGSAINTFSVNGDVLATVPTLNRTVTVNIYADGKLVRSIGRFNQMARLPAGFKARKWQIEVTGDMPVEQVTLATTGAELMGV